MNITLKISFFLDNDGHLQLNDDYFQDSCGFSYTPGVCFQWEI